MCRLAALWWLVLQRFSWERKRRRKRRRSLLESLIVAVCLGDFGALLPNSAAVFQESKIPESASCLLARLRGTGSLQARRSKTLLTAPEADVPGLPAAEGLQDR